MKYRLFVVGISLFMIAVSAGPCRSATDDSTFLSGVGAHLYGLSRPEIIRQLDAIARAKLKAVRIDLPWRIVEKKRGTYEIPALWDFIIDQARSRSIEPLVILDYGNKFYDGGNKPISDTAVAGFAGYAGAMADHFKGRVRLFEVWNEWNGTTGNTTPGRPEDYLKLAAAAYPVIKQKAPSSIVIVGASSSQGFQSLIQPKRHIAAWQYFDRLLDLGLLQYGDALSIHPYTLFLQPASGIANTASGYSRYMAIILARIGRANGGKPFPTYVTEIGWPSGPVSAQPFVTEAEQASYVVQSIVISRSMPGVAGAFLYELQDGGNDHTNRENNFGLLYYNGTPKPSYKALQRLMNTDDITE
jgi:hypothetical protein